MDSVITFFTEPLAHEFMRRALIMSVLVAVVCSIFSCFLVLKGWSLMGDAVSHAVLPGLVIATVLGIPVVIGAFASGLFCAIATGYLKANSRVKEDAVMGIVFSGMFAFGLVLLTRIETELHLLHVLFGNVLGTTEQELVQAGSIAAVCSLILLIKRKDFMLLCFDPSHARAVGLPVRALHVALLILLAMTIVSALKAAGIILVVAMLIAPGAIGFLVTRSFDKMMLVAVMASVASCTAGTIFSYHLDVATAPLIVLIQASLFLTILATGKFLNSFEGLPNADQETKQTRAHAG
ncbi:MAG: metal ABC transporter permease [Pseudomonadota bacterium]